MSNAARALPGARSKVRRIAVEFDLDNVTLDQMDAFEEMSGESFDEAFATQPILLPDGQPLYNRDGDPMFRRVQKLSHLRVMLKVLNPDLTDEQIGSVRLVDAMGGNEKSRPTKRGEPSEPESGPSSPPSSA